MGRISSHVGGHSDVRKGFARLCPVRLLLIGLIGFSRLTAAEPGNQWTGTAIDRIDEMMEINPAGARELAEEILNRPDSADPLVEATVRVKLAALARMRGDLDQANREASRAIELTRALGNEPLLASALNEQVGVRLGEGRISEALELAEESLQLRRRVGDQAEVAKTLNNIGLIHSQTGRLVEALSYYLESLRLKELIGDTHSTASTLNNIAVVRFEMGDFEESEACLTRARTIFEAVGDRTGLADVLDNLGRTRRAAGDLDGALGFHLQSLELERELGRPEGIAISLNHAGLVYNSLGRYEDALDSSRAALAINRELGIPRGLAFSLLHLGIAQVNLGWLETASATFQEGITFARRAADRSMLRDSLANLAEVQAELGRYTEAYAALVEARQLDRLIFSRESANAMAEIEAGFQLEQKDREIEVLQLERELQHLTIERGEQQIALLAEENKVNRLTRNSMIGALAGVIICLIVLQSRYRLKRGSELALQEKNAEIVRQKEVVEAQGRKIGEANRELHLTNLKLRELSRAVEQSPTGVLITDRSGSITYINPRFTEATGYTLEDLRGANPRVFKSGQHGREFYRKLWSTIQTGRVWRGRFVNRRKDGSLYQEEATISPVINEVGEIFNFVAVMEFHPADGAGPNGSVDSRVREQARRVKGILETQILPALKQEEARPESRSPETLRPSVEALEGAIRLLSRWGLDPDASENRPDGPELSGLGNSKRPDVLAWIKHGIDRKVLACLLGRLNSNLTLISDAGQVLASLAATPFDVLILDPDPGDESIPALLGRVREVARIKGGNPLRVVYIADPDDGESAQWLAAGIDVVLERPITLAALRDKALAVDWTADGREMASGHSAQREAT